MTSHNLDGLNLEEKLFGDTSPCSISALWNSKNAAPLISILRLHSGSDTAYPSNALIKFLRKPCRWPSQQASGHRWTCLVHASGQLELPAT